MSARSRVRQALLLLSPLALCLTLYLYLYPVFHGCVFPSTDASVSTAFAQTLLQHGPLDASNPKTPPSTLAAFRLLVLADPQLEGDSSLPDPNDGLISRISSHWKDIVEADAGGNGSSNGNHSISAIQKDATHAVRQIFYEDLPRSLKALRKRLDLFGNDYYLAHIYRTLHWWTKPTHVTVLGDLIGSQWVTDEEFEYRGWRFWNRVFASGRRVEDSVANRYSQPMMTSVSLSDSTWSNRIINVVGNHDIGYAGDITRDRMVRFERVFGKANWDIRFEYPLCQINNYTGIVPRLHLIVLNSLNLDTPAMDGDIQAETYQYLTDLVSERIAPVEDTASFMLLLTHVPLHKEAGICVDGPFFDFYDDNDCDGKCLPHGLKEQNHLSEQASQPGVLEGLFGMSSNVNAPAHGKGRNGLILTGHDHEGCDVWHYTSLSNAPSDAEAAAAAEDKHKTHWHAERYAAGLRTQLPSAHTGVREVTLRSMMGEFGGNAGLLSAWFDFERGEWAYTLARCSLGIQHIWWAVHILDIVTLALAFTWALWALEAVVQGAKGPVIGVNGGRVGKTLKTE